MTDTEPKPETGFTFTRQHFIIGAVILLIIFVLWYFYNTDSIEPLLDELRKLQKKIKEEI